SRPGGAARPPPPPAGHAHVVKSMAWVFSNDCLPSIGCGPIEVDGDYLAVGSLEIRSHVNHVLAISNRCKLRVIALDHGSDGRTDVRILRIAKIRDVQAVVVVRSARNGDQQVAAILRPRASDEPRGLVLTFVNQLVLRLRRADSMVIERLPSQRRLEHLAWRRLRVARVEKALRVFRP